MLSAKSSGEVLISLTFLFKRNTLEYEIFSIKFAYRIYSYVWEET